MSRAPQRIALLVGCQTNGLGGFEHDLARVGECVDNHRFDRVHELRGDGAVRENVLGCLDDLVCDVRPGDAYLFYYRGHGRRCRFRECLAPGLPADLEWNYFATARPPGARGFAEILGVEISARIAALAAVTSNVTTILDCCHAEAMLVRGEIESFDRPDHLPQLHDTIAKLLAKQQLFVEHPTVVRLSAATMQSKALESRTDGGVFTRLLTELLLEPDARKQPWAAIISRVREQLRQNRDQWPSLAGPRGRLPFSIETVEIAGELGYTGDDHEQYGWLRGGRLQGLDAGAQVSFADDTEPIGADVVSINSTRARIRFRGARRPKLGALACPTRLASTMEISVVGRSSMVEWVTRRLAECPRMRVTGDSSLVLRIAEQITLERAGVELRVPRPVEELDAIIEDLEALARSEAFLAGSIPDCELGWRHDWIWEVILHGDEPRALREGDTVHHGDQISLSFYNTSRHPHPHLFFNLLDHGVAGKLALLTAPVRTGVEVRKGACESLYRAPGSRSRCRVAWPREVPVTTEPRAFELLCVISDGPLDLTPVTASRGLEPSAVLEHTRGSVRPPDLTAWSVERLTLRLAARPRPSPSCCNSPRGRETKKS